MTERRSLGQALSLSDNGRMQLDDCSRGGCVYKLSGGRGRERKGWTLDEAALALNLKIHRPGHRPDRGIKRAWISLDSVLLFSHRHFCFKACPRPGRLPPRVLPSSHVYPNITIVSPCTCQNLSFLQPLGGLMWSHVQSPHSNHYSEPPGLPDNYGIDPLSTLSTPPLFSSRPLHLFLFFASQLPVFDPPGEALSTQLSLHFDTSARAGACLGVLAFHG
jgi:hypothetical protein